MQITRVVGKITNKVHPIPFIRVSVKNSVGMWIKYGPVDLMSMGNTKSLDYYMSVSI